MIINEVPERLGGVEIYHTVLGIKYLKSGAMNQGSIFFLRKLLNS